MLWVRNIQKVKCGCILYSFSNRWYLLHQSALGIILAGSGLVKLNTYISIISFASEGKIDPIARLALPPSATERVFFERIRSYRRTGNASSMVTIGESSRALGLRGVAESHRKSYTPIIRYGVSWFVSIWWTTMPVISTINDLIELVLTVQISTPIDTTISQCCEWYSHFQHKFHVGNTKCRLTCITKSCKAGDGINVSIMLLSLIHFVHLQVIYIEQGASPDV